MNRRHFCNNDNSSDRITVVQLLSHLVTTGYHIFDLNGAIICYPQSLEYFMTLAYVVLPLLVGVIPSGDPTCRLATFISSSGTAPPHIHS
uniref:Uncharacterized protein n=1 Tax=Hyaloperonospora arabidopsidis (strain Emoy2) TaxID=559515 RepID=M4B8F1_HYAAE